MSKFAEIWVIVMQNVLYVVFKWYFKWNWKEKIKLNLQIFAAQSDSSHNKVHIWQRHES